MVYYPLASIDQTKFHTKWFNTARSKLKNIAENEY